MRGRAGQAGPVEPTCRPVVRHRLQQSFRYDYDGPASSLLHRLVVVPPRRHGGQRLRLAAVQVSDPAAQVDWERDGWGNALCRVRLAEVPSRLEMTVSVVADRWTGPHLVPAELLRDPRLRQRSLLTGPSPRLARLADALSRDDVLAMADDLCARIPGLIRYTPGATTVRTTAAQALDGGVGVCQDQAHVMLALLRLAGHPCRYVSGHLAGEGGTHAWVEVVAPHPSGAQVIAYDPCHARRVDARSLVVAVGRDYLDVAPTSGWYSGDARGTLTADRCLLSEALAA